MAGILQKKKFNESCKKITKYALKKKMNRAEYRQFQTIPEISKGKWRG